MADAEDHIHVYLDGKQIWDSMQQRTLTSGERYLTDEAARMVGGHGWFRRYYELENCLKCDRAFRPRDGFIAFCWRCS